MPLSLLRPCGVDYLGRRIPMQPMLCWQQGQVRVGWLGGSIPSSCCSNGNSKHCIWCKMGFGVTA
ncbi:hypothetical protein [Motilimonas sp. E26]|uniref:hypothetical protein n=1 Tax=Motilimonas sp. E26 TaxID=2865674 RepID=UPI001E41E8BD|nr:hypothetical protein [Motilimonas sp. E26]MCE0559261.1 hypothetical protein [Motilimonas sp. E26]